MRHKCLLSVLTISLSTALICSAQGSRPAGGSTGAGSTGSTGSTTSPTLGRTPSTTTTTPGTTQPQQTDIPRPIFLSGRVMLSDGTAPDDSVRIERVCGTRTFAEGYTDRKGHFGVELGRNTAMFMEASNDSTEAGFGRPGASSTMSRMGAGSTVTERSLMGCDLRAVLPGFRSTTISLTNRRSLDSPDVGTIILKRIGNVEGLTVSATTMAAPKDARKAYEKGREFVQKGKFDDAAKQLDKAVELYPQFAMAWYERGRVYEAKNDIPEARKAFQKSIEADTRLVQPYERMAALALQDRQWKDAADTSARIIRLNSWDFPQAYLFNAIANLQLENLAEAEKSATELIRNDTSHRFPSIEHVIAVIYAKKQDWENSAKHFHAYLDIAEPGNTRDLATKQLAEVEKTLAAAKQ